MDWSEVEDFDLLTWSSPCQDFSNAGLQKGGEEGSGTRSSLLWHVKDAIAAKRPRSILFENVKGFVSGSNMAEFRKLHDYLTREGYSVFAQVLNAKDYGVPQNRERCYIVAILGDAWYNFPQPKELDRSMQDVLEEEVAGKYYLDQARVDRFISALPPEKLAMLEGL